MENLNLNKAFLAGAGTALIGLAIGTTLFDVIPNLYVNHKIPFSPPGVPPLSQYEWAIANTTVAKNTALGIFSLVLAKASRAKGSLPIIESFVPTRFRKNKILAYSAAFASGALVGLIAGVAWPQIPFPSSSKPIPV